MIARRLDEPATALGPGVTIRMLRGADALVLHVWWQPANFLSALAARVRRIPYLIYAESTLESRRFDRGPAAALRSLVFRHAGAVLVPGPAAAEAAVEHGARPHRVVETVNSVDLDRYGRRVREIRRGSLPARSSGHRYVCIGQLIERKNVGALIRAFATTRTGDTLDVAGDGVEMTALRTVALEYGLTERVRFHGFLEPDRVLELLASCQTLVLPSTEEVYGYTALESYAAGLQVVVSSRAGVASTLEGRPGAWIVEPDDADLARALGEARDGWSDWRADDDLEFASPRRVALDIVRAVEIARGGRR